MIGTFLFLCGVVFGMCTMWLATRRHHHILPPATAKQLARARRANRAELRLTRGSDLFVSPPNADFEDGDTQ